MEAVTEKISIRGFDVEVGKLTKNVISCKQAATAKKISLENELKSLLLDTGKGLFMLHLPGDKRADFRAIRQYLKTKRVQLANLSALNNLQCEPGTVNPFSNEGLQNLPHLISKELFEKNMLSTNYGGTLSVFIKFHPELLGVFLDKDQVYVGRFSED